MLFQWLVAFVAVAILVVAVYSDALTGKKKHSKYFQSVQIPKGKAERIPVTPELSFKTNQFLSKLNIK